MSEAQIQQSLKNLGRALQRLEEALAETPTNSLYIDGTIQRFEFSIELFWKTFKRLLASEGIEAITPKECLKKAYEVQWIHNETAWLQMLRDRNETSHIYDEELARRIYQNIMQNYPELKKTYLFLVDRFKHQ
jgi:nucleotidyltransferase substrate binding protein (TIGR01987 family)